MKAILFLGLCLLPLTTFAEAPLQLFCSAEYMGGTEFPATHYSSIPLDQKEGRLTLVETDRQEPYSVTVRYERLEDSRYDLNIWVGRIQSRPDFETRALFDGSRPQFIAAEARWYPTNGSPLLVECSVRKADK